MFIIMTKEKLYQKLSTLFPTELGVGDIVVYGGRWRILIAGKANCYCLPSASFREHVGGSWIPTKDLKLIRKTISLSMVLEKMINVGFSLLNGGIVEFSALYKTKDDNHSVTHYATWQLRKDGKDLSLYDQSIELLELVYEVLK